MADTKDTPNPMADAQEDPPTQTQHDPYAFILDLSRMSFSEEELVQNSTFVSGDLPSSPTHTQNHPVVSDTQDVPHEEDYSLPSSDVHLSAVDHAVDADALDSVDLGKDSQLGFLEVQAETSLAAGGDALGDCAGVESEKAKESARKGKEKLVSENDGCFTSGTVAKKPRCDIEQGSEMQNKSDEGPSVLPPSECRPAENVASEGSSSRKLTVFDVFRALSQITNDEDEDDDDNPNLIDDARAIGIVFPRPRWHPKDFKP